MRAVGNDVYIQRGETWSLDLDIKNEAGDPYMLFSGWRNPYLAITVTAARYEQPGDFRVTYWLDLSKQRVEQRDGSFVEQAIKRFIQTEALPLSVFSAQEAVNVYGITGGGRMVLDDTSDYDVTNFLFFTDPQADGNRIYKYVSSYTLDANGQVNSEAWTEYNFRLVKSFVTKDWTEQGYLYDAKILAGDTVAERVKNVLLNKGIVTNALPWSDAYLVEQIAKMPEGEEKADAEWACKYGMPLMPDYDTKTLVLEPRNLYVSANIQGGVK